MKILEICGSPRKSGHTQFILDQCKKKLNVVSQEENVTYDRISIYHSNLDWCKGCRLCFKLSETKCPHKDDLLDIKSRMENADIIIIGSPICVEDVSGGFKNWLDRMAFNCHRPFLDGKSVYVFTTSAAKASKHGIKTITRAITSWGGSVISYDNFIIGEDFNTSDFNTSDFDKNYAALITKRMIPLTRTYHKESVSLYSLISFGIQKRYWKRKIHTADYQYWLDKKWFSPGTLYFRPIKVNIFKRYITSTVCWVVATFIL